MKMQLVGARREPNVILEVALASVPINIRIQCSKDSFGGTATDGLGTTGEEAIRAPRASAAVYVGVGGADDHPQIGPAGRCFWNNGGSRS